MEGTLEVTFSPNSPNPRQKQAHKILIQHAAFYYYCINHQIELEQWLKSKNNPSFNTQYQDIREKLSAYSLVEGQFDLLLKKIRYETNENVRHHQIYAFFAAHEDVVEIIQGLESNSLLNQFIQDQVDIKRILNSSILFYINFAFFYDEFEQWAVTKKDQAEFQQTYAQMKREFWECVGPAHYKDFVNALILYRDKKDAEFVKALNELVISHPKAVAFLVRYEHSHVISVFTKELNGKTAEINEILSNAIKIYTQRQKEPDKSPGAIERSKTKSVLEASAKEVRLSIFDDMTTESTSGRTFTTFLFGTGSEKNDHKNPMYGSLGESVSYFAHMMDLNHPGKEYIDFVSINGPGSGNKRDGEFLRKHKTYSDLLGTLFGYGMEENITQALDCMKYEVRRDYPKNKDVAEKIHFAKESTASGELAPITRVNIVGWSRGAVTAIMLANRMEDDKDLKDIEINLFLFDPVPGTGVANRSNRLLSNPKIKNCYIFVALHERSFGFSGLIPQRAPTNQNTKIFLYSSVGGHPTIVCNPFWRYPDAQGNPKRVTKTPLKVDAKATGKALAETKSTTEEYYDLSHSGLSIRHLIEVLLKKHGTVLFPPKAIEKNKLNYSLLGLRDLVQEEKNNLNGYQLLQTECYTTVESGDRKMTFGFDYILSHHRLNDLPPFKTSNPLGTLAEEIKNRFKEYHQEFSAELNEVSKKLRISARRTLRKQSLNQFYALVIRHQNLFPAITSHRFHTLYYEVGGALNAFNLRLAVFQLPRENYIKTIEKAYRKQAILYHPDKETGNEEQFKKLTNQRDLLLGIVDFKAAPLLLEAAAESELVRRETLPLTSIPSPDPETSDRELPQRVVQTRKYAFDLASFQRSWASEKTGDWEMHSLWSKSVSTKSFNALDVVVKNGCDPTDSRQILLYLEKIYNSATAWIRAIKKSSTDENLDHFDAVEGLQQRAEYNYYYCKLSAENKFYFSHPVIHALRALKKFVDDEAPTTGSKYVKEIKFLLDSAQNEVHDPVILFTRCRALIQERLNSTVGNFLATSFFGSRTPKIDTFYQEFATVTLVATTNAIGLITLEDFKGHLDNGYAGLKK